MSSGLLGWLYGRRKIKLISSVNRHLDLAARCVGDVVEASRKALEGEEYTGNLEILARREEEADRLRRTIIHDLTKSELTAEDKDDLSHLVKRVDMIADYARGAGRILAVLSDLSRLPERLKQSIRSMVDLLPECSQATKKCIETLLNSRDQALSYADQVERIEEEVDEAYARCRKMLIEEAGDMPAAYVVLLAQFLDALEDTADSCEDTIDQVRIIAVHIR